MTTALVASTEARMFDALARLGCTAFEVAARLQAMGITGFKKSGDACPVALYLDAFCRGVHSVDRETAYELVPESTEIELPPVVRIFVRQFDQGMYPELERKSDTDYSEYEIVDDVEYEIVDDES